MIQHHPPVTLRTTVLKRTLAYLCLLEGRETLRFGIQFQNLSRPLPALICGRKVAKLTTSPANVESISNSADTSPLQPIRWSCMPNQCTLAHLIYFQLSERAYRSSDAAIVSIRHSCKTFTELSAPFRFRCVQTRYAHFRAGPRTPFMHIDCS